MDCDRPAAIARRGNGDRLTLAQRRLSLCGLRFAIVFFGLAGERIWRQFARRTKMSHAEAPATLL
jgi:hypothetical protein